jgi:hypothetical protein
MGQVFAFFTLAKGATAPAAARLERRPIKARHHFTTRPLRLMSRNANESHQAAAAPANPFIGEVEMIEISPMIRVREVLAHTSARQDGAPSKQSRPATGRAGEDLGGGVTVRCLRALYNLGDHRAIRDWLIQTVVLGG